jgi:hypothetical protein
MGRATTIVPRRAACNNARTRNWCGRCCVVVVVCVDLRSQGSSPSSIGAVAFHDPVRDGTGWFHYASHTHIGSGDRIRTCDLRVMSPTSCHCSTPRRTNCLDSDSFIAARPTAGQWAGKPSTVRTSNLHASRRFQSWPLNPVVSRESYQPIAERAFIFRCISHLDAFSGSCFRT